MTANYQSGFMLDEDLDCYIEPMLASGLYGETRGDLFRVLIREGVINAIRSNVVSVIFAEVKEAPAAKEPCPICHDQWDAPGACPKCGNDGMPF